MIYSNKLIAKRPARPRSGLVADHQYIALGAHGPTSPPLIPGLFFIHSHRKDSKRGKKRVSECICESATKKLLRAGPACTAAPKF